MTLGHQDDQSHCTDKLREVEWSAQGHRADWRQSQHDTQLTASAGGWPLPFIHGGPPSQRQKVAAQLVLAESKTNLNIPTEESSRWKL